jgi:S-DNA-T family DNA segregation ATPase FtsK/SpoIIIE
MAADPSLVVAWFGLVVAAVFAVCLIAVLLLMVRWAARMWWQSRLLIGLIVTVGLWVRFGSVRAAGLLAGVTVVLVAWRLASRRTFERVVVWPMRFGRRRAWYRRNWQALMDGHRLGHKRRGRDDRAYPRLGRVRCGAWLDRLTLRPLVGQSVEDFEAITESLAMAMGARECRVAVHEPGVLRVEVLWADALETVVPAPEVAEPVDLERVPIGIGEDGLSWTTSLAENHQLVVGCTGAGKSSVVWSTLRAIAPAVHAGTVELWGIDPKGGMELAPGRPLFARFGAGGLSEMVELLEEAVSVMRERATRYAGHRRKHAVTAEEPLIVVLVDEVAFLTAYVGDHKLRDRVNKALATLLTQGRAVGVCVIAALQDPRKEVLGFRNLFPTKIALRLDERTQVDMVLGDGARAAGAKCDQISPSLPGVGYVKVDGVREPRRVRAAFVTDDDIAELARRYAPEAREAAA